MVSHNKFKHKKNQSQAELQPFKGQIMSEDENGKRSRMNTFNILQLEHQEMMKFINMQTAGSV